MESEKSGFTNKMSEIWRKMQVKYFTSSWTSRLSCQNLEFASLDKSCNWTNGLHIDQIQSHNQARPILFSEPSRFDSSKQRFLLHRHLKENDFIKHMYSIFTWIKIPIPIHKRRIILRLA